MFMSGFRLFVLLSVFVLMFFSCTDKKTEVKKYSDEQIYAYLEKYGEKILEYENSANEAIDVLVTEMGPDLEEFKTKDFTKLNDHAAEAEKLCNYAADYIKESAFNLPQVLSDSVRNAIVKVSIFLNTAYKNRASAMKSAQDLFSDSLEIHFSVMSSHLTAAAKNNDKGSRLFSYLKKKYEKK